mgnify:CR=1 FL=1
MNNNHSEKNWRKTAGAFNSHAEEYDNWYAENALFESECRALQAITTQLPHPRLEIGVGPGRFAEFLDCRFGVDPAEKPLKMASTRNILPVQAVGENLPFGSKAFGTVFILFTLCFITRPEELMREVFRILQQNGKVVFGMIPSQSPWGKTLTRKKEQGHRLYRHASFFRVSEVAALLEMNNFTIVETITTLLQEPADTPKIEQPVHRLDKNGGFVVLTAVKA